MKKFFLFLLFFLIFCIIGGAVFFIACKSKKESIGPQLEGTWKTDWNTELKKPLNKMEVNEGISFFSIPTDENRGNFESAYVGVVEYKGKNNKAPIEFIVTVPGTWIVQGHNKLILKYDVSKIDILVSHDKLKFDIIGTVGDLAGDIFTGNWGGALKNVVGTVSNIGADGRIDDEAQKKLKEYFRDMLSERNKEKITYSSVKIANGQMTCDPGGMFKSKIVFYKTDDTPVHLINSVVDIEDVQEQEETNERLDYLDSLVQETFDSLDISIPDISDYLSEPDSDENDDTEELKKKNN